MTELYQAHFQQGMKGHADPIILKWKLNCVPNSLYRNLLAPMHAVLNIMCVAEANMKEYTKTVISLHVCNYQFVQQIRD